MCFHTSVKSLSSFFTFMRIFFLLLLFLGVASCRQQNPSQVKDNQNMSKIDFVNGTDFQFGRYSTRDTMVHYFVYKNISKIPFVISKIETSCGCTRATFNPRPLQPGHTDSIRVAYDGSGFLEGPWYKTCTIYSNADTTFVLRIKGTYYAAE